MLAALWLAMGASSAFASAPAVVKTIAVGSEPEAISSDGTHVWVANLKDDTVSEIDASTATVVNTIPVPPVYAPPEGVSSDGTHVWVTNDGSGNAITEIDASTGAVVKTIQVDACSNFGDPYGVSSDGTHVWVTVPDCGVVGEVDASTGTLIGGPSVGDDPTGVSSDGTHVWVTNGGDDTVSEIDASTGTVVKQIPVGPGPAWVSSDGTHVWVANQEDDTVSEIDALTGTVVGTILVGSEPYGVSSDGTHVWVTMSDNAVSEIDASTGAIVGMIPVGSEPGAVSSDGTDVWVANSGANTVSEIRIGPGSPSISTTQQPASATVGSPIADQATVSGGDSPSGTVTFDLYDNPNATGTPLFTDTEPLSGGTATSASYTTTATGTDYWVATYNGDANNNQVSSATAAEPVVINAACGGMSSNAAFTAFAVASSDAQCKTTVTVTHSVLADDLTFYAKVVTAAPGGVVTWTEVTGPDGKKVDCPYQGVGNADTVVCTFEHAKPGSYTATAAFSPDDPSYPSASSEPDTATVDPPAPPSEFSSAKEDTQKAGIWCMAAPSPNPVTGVTPVLNKVATHSWEEDFCSLFNDLAIDDYAPSEDQSQLAHVTAAASDPSFRVVFQPKPFTVPRLGTCALLRGASCRRFRKAEVQYLDALARVASLSEAVAVAANRFAGAKDAGDHYAEWLQGAAETKYLPLQASAVSRLHRAGRRLGTLLRRDHLNTTLNAKQVARGQKRLGKLDGVSRSLVTRLERDGLITSRKDLERIIAALLKKEPPARATTLAQLFGT